MYKLSANLAFQRVTLTPELIELAKPLLQRHYEEVARYKDIPLDPDWDVYANVERAGMLRVYLLTDGGVLKGYAAYFLRKNPHYKTSLQAIQDVLFVDPALRGGLVSARFIAWCDEQLAAEGVQAVFHHVKFTRNFGSRLTRLGYEPIEVIWGKRLDR